MPENDSSSKKLLQLTKNYILNALPNDDFERLLPVLEPIEFTIGQKIYRAEEPIESVYFLNQAMVSVIATTAQGQTAEVGVIGHEGIVGIDVLLGAESALNDSIIQIPGNGLRISAKTIEREFKRGGRLQELLLAFTRLMMMQISQTALCNRLHTVEERLSRWLLLSRDRTTSDELQLTQEFLSIMIGANRATVTTSAISLQGGGFIKYSRGSIVIVDREGLEHFCCDCYRTVKQEYNRVQK